MKYLVATLLFASLLIAMPVGPVMAGTGHSHGQPEISGEEAIERASKAIAKLADAKKVDASWVGIAADKVVKKTFSNGPEWVVIFKNDKIKDPSKQTLYVFLSLWGEALGANFTGE